VFVAAQPVVPGLVISPLTDATRTGDPLFGLVFVKCWAPAGLGLVAGLLNR